jgi:hypothetical protein
MKSTKRFLLGCSHLAVLGLGAMIGLRGLPEPIHGDSPSEGMALTAPSLPMTEPVPVTTKDSTVAQQFTTRDYASAWDSLKGRFLPKQERLLIQRALLQEWSAIDLEAAVRAVFAETTDEGPGQIGRVSAPSLLDLCAPGIRADPLKAWKLVRSKAFGWETPRFCQAWLECMTTGNPVSVFPILGELPKRERLYWLTSLAESCCGADDPETRATIWNQFSALPDAVADKEFITHVAKTISWYTPPAELATRLLGEPKPTGRNILVQALALRLLDEKDYQTIPKLLQTLPAEVQGEVAAASLPHAADYENHALFLADFALDSGNLDALQAAAADPAYARFAKELNQPLALADWALRLPEDPRTLEIYRQTIEGTARGDLEGVRAKIESLPPGWHREEGLKIISKLGKHKEAESE